MLPQKSLRGSSLIIATQPPAKPEPSLFIRRLTPKVLGPALTQLCVYLTYHPSSLGIPRTQPICSRRSHHPRFSTCLSEHQTCKKKTTKKTPSILDFNQITNSPRVPSVQSTRNISTRRTRTIFSLHLTGPT